MSEERIKKILNEAFFAYLCTIDETKQPYITPMFFVFDQKTFCIYLLSNINSKKIDNMRYCPYVSITVDLRDPANPLNNEGIMIQGEVDIKSTAKTVDISSPMVDTTTSNRGREWYIYRLFKEKYPSTVLSEIEKHISPEVIIKIKPEKIVHWKGSNFKSIYPFQ